MLLGEREQKRGHLGRWLAQFVSDAGISVHNFRLQRDEKEVQKWGGKAEKKK